MDIENLAGHWPNVAINPATGKTYETKDMDNGVSVHMCPNDSREKLEAEVRRIAFQFSPDTTPDGNPEYELRAEIMDLLDRQAAITERHWMEICGASANANIELKRQIDELKNDIKYLRKVCQTQADSFAAIENENAALRSKLNRIRELAERLQDA